MSCDIVLFRFTIIWERIILIIWKNPTEARSSVLPGPQSAPTGAPRTRSSGASVAEQRLHQALAGWVGACVARCPCVAWDVTGPKVQNASTS